MNWSAVGGRIDRPPILSNPKLAQHRSSELRTAVRQRAEGRDVVVAYLALAALVAGVVCGVYTSLL